MPYDVFVAMFVFAAVTAFTPGPNNIMVTASGVNFGFARTIPHLAGILIGFMVMLVACGAGLGALFTAYAPLQYALKIVGAAYMLWLAWKVANARPADDEPDASARPLTFLQAAAFQWVNPKAWVIAISAIAIYVRPSHWLVDFADPACGVRALYRSFDRDLDRVRRGLARPAAKSPPRPHFQLGHGRAAGRQHRADGHLSHETANPPGSRRNQTP